MPENDKISAKEIIAAVAILVVIGLAILFTLRVFTSESEQHEIIVSDIGAKRPDNLEVFIKLLSIDPIKGDASARLEFLPHGKLENDGDLTRDLKLYIPSANGKTEIDFKKGKAIPPVEAVFSMYGGNATDYPFDSHKAGFYVYSEKVGEDKKEPAKAAATDENDEGAKAPATESDSLAVPLDVSFFGSIPGYKIGVEKGKETDETFVEGDITIARSGTVVFFSMFVAALMWGLSVAVLFLVLAVILRGRKPELGMFSFMAALLFAYYAVRNSQPNVPPIGVFSDFIAFFFAEILVGACLLVTVFTWVFRSGK